MKAYYTSLLLLSLGACVTMQAQDVLPQLNAAANLPHAGDSLCLREVDYFPAGNAGENQIWDFSDLEYLENKHAIRFRCDSDSTFLYGMEPAIVHKYRVSNDSLKMLGYETSLKTMDYQVPVTLFSYPCSYGAYFSQPFQGIGTYCKKYILETHGMTESEADASGTIYTANGDTIRHVLRIHQVLSSAISQHLPTDTVAASDNLKQRIEERYQWYARGYRYPLYETISVTIFNDLDPVSCQQAAYCTLPSDLLELEDSVNRQILALDSLELQMKEQPPVIHYTISVEANAIKVNYSLDADATIHAIVCDRMGLVYQRKTSHGEAQSTGMISIDRGGLRDGLYVLYLNVNGQIFNEKLELK